MDLNGQTKLQCALQSVSAESEGFTFSSTPIYRFHKKATGVSF